MQALIEVILPVFLVIGFGYAARWRNLFGDQAVDALTRFATSYGIPCMLFLAIAQLDLGQEFDPALLISYYTGATVGFLAGLFGARWIFARPWTDSVAIGFACLFANSVLLGLPITERAYGTEALEPNYAIIALNAPFCYLVGIAAMEIALAGRSGILGTLRQIARTVFNNAMVIGIGLGFVVNLGGIPLPGVLNDALEMMARAALPAALFALGGVLYRYRPEGDMATIAWICVVTLVVYPAVIWVMGRSLGLSEAQFRSAVLTGAMGPGVNAYIFANMYGVARRVVASSVLIATALSVVTIWIWLAILP